MPLHQPWSKSTSAPPSQGQVRTLLPAPSPTCSKECHAKTLSATGEKATCSKGIAPALLLSLPCNCFGARSLGAVRERSVTHGGTAMGWVPHSSAGPQAAAGRRARGHRPRILTPSRDHQVTAPEQPCPSGTLPKPGARPHGETGLGRTLPSSSPEVTEEARTGEAPAPPPHAPRPGAGRAHRAEDGAGARLERSARRCPGSRCPQGLQLPGRQDSPRGRCRGCPRPVGTAGHGPGRRDEVPGTAAGQRRGTS